VSLAYNRRGTGPPLILLHGVGHRRQAWDAVLDHLTPHRDVITVDLPGHGASPPMARDRRPVDVLPAEVIGLLDELELTRPHVAGNSLGGWLALELSTRGRAATATTLSPAGFWRGPGEVRYARTVFAVMQAGGRRLRGIAPTLTRSTAGRAMLYATIVSRPSRLSARQAYDDLTAFLAARDALNAIIADDLTFTGQIDDNVPVTVAWGTRDLLISPRQAKIAKARLPRTAKFVRLPGCGHVPMTDDPRLVADVLLRGSSTPADR
jgi:pimeloyl-ACP methyl ester carboxylesterase